MLRHELETFDDVPVISFGWVALFILFYIALVGPLDYFILKKLFKRLELTWVTFPVTVVAVSVAAYFTAYGLKGEDLRIRKIDLVDVDLVSAGPRGAAEVYGTTWFGLFSPRPQSYTVGLEPAAPNWADLPPANAPATTALLGMMEVGDAGLSRPAQGRFVRPYDLEAAGLRRMPIGTWAAQSFFASWRAPLPAQKPPVEIRDVTDKPGRLSLSRGARDGTVAGSVTNNLGVELQAASLLHGDRWYDLGTLAPNQTVRLEALAPRPRQEWFTRATLSPHAAAVPVGRPLDAAAFTDHRAGPLMQTVLFQNAFDVRGASSKRFRALDQSWRLKQPGEAVLVARTPLVLDRAEALTENPASPSRLWVGALPGDRPVRPTLPGEMSQETFLRVFIPVEPGK